MNIVILGAGEVGKQLASALNEKQNNLTVVDISPELIGRLSERLDVMTVVGDGSDAQVLKKAGARKADILIATTGNDASNILACQIARRFNVAKTICRLSSSSYFSAEDGITPESFGIERCFFPEDECVRMILYALERRCVVERHAFRVPNTRLTGFRVPSRSPLVGARVSDFPDRELLKNVRFPAIVRDRKLLTPHGQTIFAADDEVYVTGSDEHVEATLDIADPETGKTKEVLLAGATRLGINLLTQLIKRGYRVRLIEKDLALCESTIDIVGPRIMIINGDPTAGDILDEAGVSGCDAFIGALRDDEENILSCAIAKEFGAKKTVCVTNKAEYRDIIPATKAIDCGFSPRVVAVNAVLNLLGDETVRVHAILNRYHAYVYEFDVNPKSRAENKYIREFERSLPAVLAMVFRGDAMMPANGDLQLLAGDKVAAIAVPATLKELEPFFRERGLFGL